MLHLIPKASRSATEATVSLWRYLRVCTMFVLSIFVVLRKLLNLAAAWRKSARKFREEGGAKMAQSVNVRPLWKRPQIRSPDLTSLLRLLFILCSFSIPLNTRKTERWWRGVGKMNAPLTSSLPVELLSRVIDVKYSCFFYFTFHGSFKGVQCLGDCIIKLQ